MSIAELILALISATPQAIVEITALYETVKTDMSLTDQTQVEAALASAQASDAAATATADTALDDASKQS